MFLFRLTKFKQSKIMTVMNKLKYAGGFVVLMGTLAGLSSNTAESLQHILMCKRILDM